MYTENEFQPKNYDVPCLHGCEHTQSEALLNSEQVN